MPDTPLEPYADLATYASLPRLTGLALGPDRLVASMQQPDDDGARYTSSLWEIPLDGAAPTRLTRSDKGETSPVFTADGTLLFVSARPEADGGSTPGEDGDLRGAALFALPATGEPTVLASRAGGLSGPVVARGSGTTVVLGNRLVHTVADDGADDDDASRREMRSQRKVSAILHDGMPIRFWDHELGEESPRLFVVGDDGALRDLTPDVRSELDGSDCSITDDGATVTARWRRRLPHGRHRDGIAVIDVATGERRVLEADDRAGASAHYSGARIAPDGGRIAAELGHATFNSPARSVLLIVDTATGHAEIVDTGDLTAAEWVWSPDSGTVYVSGDLRGRGAVLAVDAATAAVTRTLVDDAVYSSLQISRDGAHVYALRATMDHAAAPVRLDVGDTNPAPRPLATPAPTPPVPGTAEEVWLEGVGAEGADVHSWVFTPAGDGPHPVMLWIHGGPFASYNCWSWRWNPWVAVAHGWAVILPDPALSTGYGQGCIDRAWPYRADVVWGECERVLDHLVQRPELDETRTALLGASFGGFMTNWIAGHTDRFAAIVTHAGLWALDQQHATTDAAAFKTGVFGRLAEHPDWYANYSPHNFVDKISTPMLIVHGNRDYRVPVSEALRLWWDLVSRWADEPAAMPHRFLQLTGENHWVLSPANAEIWYDVVLGFCGQHVLGRDWTPSPLL